MKKTYLWKLIVYITIGITAFAAYGKGYNVWAAALLIAEALLIYGMEIRESGFVISLKGLLGFSWLGGMGLAC